MKAHTCELRIPSRNSPDTFETVHPTAFDLRHAMDPYPMHAGGTDVRRRHYEHSGDESDDEEAGAVDVDYFTTLLQQGERY